MQFEIECLVNHSSLSHLRFSDWNKSVVFQFVGNRGATKTEYKIEKEEAIKLAKKILEHYKENDT